MSTVAQNGAVLAVGVESFVFCLFLAFEPSTAASVRISEGEPALALEPLESPLDEPDAEAAAWSRARTLPDGRGAPRSGAGRESTGHIPDSSKCLVATRLNSAMASHAQPMLQTCHLQSQANPEYESAMTATAANGLIVRLWHVQHHLGSRETCKDAPEAALGSSLGSSLGSTPRSELFLCCCGCWALPWASAVAVAAAARRPMRAALPRAARKGS